MNLLLRSGRVVDYFLNKKSRQDLAINSLSPNKSYRNQSMTSVSQSVSQLTGFYMRATLVLNGLMRKKIKKSYTDVFLETYTLGI